MAAGTPRLRPSLIEEEALWTSGSRIVAGVDEVGRGPLAGPLVAAAVVLDPDRLPDWVSEVADSKLLTRKAREELSVRIQESAYAVGIGAASVREIDAWGLTVANSAAMKRALAALKLAPDFILVDGIARVRRIRAPQRTVIDGDALCVSISAASIVAKVWRDRIMVAMDGKHPGYDFASHKGYATRHHLRQLASLGPCPEHRRCFLPVRLAGEGRQIELIEIEPEER
jgi:ribonuclease HII